MEVSQLQAVSALTLESVIGTHQMWVWVGNFSWFGCRDEETPFPELNPGRLARGHKLTEFSPCLIKPIGKGWALLRVSLVHLFPLTALHFSFKWTAFDLGRGKGLRKALHYKPTYSQVLGISASSTAKMLLLIFCRLPSDIIVNFLNACLFLFAYIYI
jgi:hypothetical protein